MTNPAPKTDKANHAAASIALKALATGKHGPEGKTGKTKAERVLKLLSGAKGATLADLMNATDWQAHSVRGFISSIVRKKLGHTVEVAKDGKGTSRYRIVVRSEG